MYILLQQVTKDIIQRNPASWCHKENCNLKIFQDGNTALVASDDGGYWLHPLIYNNSQMHSFFHVIQ